MKQTKIILYGNEGDAVVVPASIHIVDDCIMVGTKDVIMIAIPKQAIMDLISGDEGHG